MCLLREREFLSVRSQYGQGRQDQILWTSDSLVILLGGERSSMCATSHCDFALLSGCILCMCVVRLCEFTNEKGQYGHCLRDQPFRYFK